MGQQLAHWQLKGFEPGTPFTALLAWGKDSTGWIDATAPGDTHAALIAAKRLAHPFQGRNEHAATSIAERAWWWRTTFDAQAAKPGERIELVFDGLDTFADIYLNGTLLGSANNMFHDWRFDISQLINSKGSNDLVLLFKPTALAVPAQDMPQWGPLSERMNVNKRNLMRKAQFGWGWDWGPDLPTVGIWRAARIERYSVARLRDVHATVKSLSSDRCELGIDIAVENHAAATGLRALMVLRNPDHQIVAKATVDLDASTHVDLLIQKPELWWTVDLGKQPLYKLEVELLHQDDTLDRSETRVGLRTITLDQSPDADEPGAMFFRFVLNGVPIFARGACWIPASSFVGVVDKAHYRKLLEQTVFANMNMIRVWGGGVYEHDEFYDLCDEMGLLVWQDFMFACAPYPENEQAFIESVRQEVQYQAKRLRNHPSMALWCGNNECQVLQQFVNKIMQSDSPLLGALYYDKLIPEELAALSPDIPYWPGSPYGGLISNSMRVGDVHDWTVWHGVPPCPEDEFIGGKDMSPAGVHYKRYAEDKGRFISEFGIHSAPPLSSLKRWMNPEDLRLEAPGFLERIKDEPKNKVYAMLEPVTGLPNNLEEYVDYTMLLQAEGLKYGLEHFRRRKPHCSGTLIWQLNDCWPCVSWSLMDYDGVGKSSLYAVSRAYAPVMASFKVSDEGIAELWLTNDTLKPIKGEAIIELLHLDGRVEWTTKIPYALRANCSESIWHGEAPQDQTDLALRVQSKDDAFARNRYLLAPIMDLQLARGARPNAAITALSPHQLEVKLSADTWLLSVTIDTPDAAFKVSDNYFDLCAGESKVIHVINNERPISANDLVIRCWNERIAQKNTGEMA